MALAVGFAPHHPGGQAAAQFATGGLLATTPVQTGTQDMQFGFAHGALQSEQQPVVKKPLYVQKMLTTGISMFAKISVGVRSIASGPTIRISTARTTKVYGRRSASRTIRMTGS
uniref:Uncharacterized protein n=1 Tax=Paraburkholderia sprentiae WSM5005 TaxID=754502 RepID=A0A1I9YR24_9BURK